MAKDKPSRSREVANKVHVEIVDLDRLIAFWQEFYPKLTDEDKSLLSLVPIYFYSPSV